MPAAYFVTHSLSSQGIQRMRLMLDQPWIGLVRAVFTSSERKARDAAHIVADHLFLSPVVVADLGENDRSATGYLPKAKFETVVDEFFARACESVRGWGSNLSRSTVTRLAGYI